MRTLNRNKTKFYYATYVSSTEIKDEYDNPTGDYKITYSKPVPMMANVSAARGTSDIDMFGISVSYDKAIVTDDLACSISESSILWVDTIPTLGDDGDTSTPHDYIVKRVAKSLNSIAYAISKVDVDYAPEEEPIEEDPPVGDET